MIMITQLLCPTRHCIIACIFDDATETAEKSVGLMKEMVAKLELNPWCGLCGSTVLKYETAKTQFATMQEATPTMLALQAGNLLAMQFYPRPQN